jgi:outer membrane protein TolC
MQGQSWLAVGGLSALLCAACTSAEQYAMQANAEVLPMVAGYEQAVLGGREASVLQPEPAKVEAKAPTTPDPAPADPAGALPPADALHLDLRSSLATAVTSSREFMTQRENLYLRGLDLSLVRYDFGPVLNGTVALLWLDGERQPGSTNMLTDVGMSQILDSGSTFRVGAGFGASAFGGSPAPGEDDPRYDGNVGFGLNVPLLRGAGYEVSHEALTQSERNLVYEVRNFELFREAFSIDIAEGYFDLVSRRQRLDNLEQNAKDALFDAKKAEALRLVDRNQDEDVFLARRFLIDADSNLLQAQADYERAVDTFKIRLGLATDTPVALREEQPPYLPVALDAVSAVTVARANRLDLITAAQRVQDVKRGVYIARNSLLPDLTLDLGLDFGGSGGTLDGSLPDTWVATAGMNLELPLNRQAERNAYRASLIELDRARRDYELLVDTVERDVRDLLRQLTRAEQQIVLQREQIEQQRRAVTVSQIRYEAGDVDNRDLIDARLSLVNAQNQLVDLLASHYIGRLRLMRSLGVLFIDRDGMWRE